MANVANFSPDPAAASQLLQFFAPNSGGKVAVPAYLFGFSVCESTGSAGAKFRLHDGEDVGDPVLYPAVTLTSNESAREWFGNQGIQIVSGAVFLEVVSGSVEGCVLWG
jgi:hypothetical protein